MMPAMLCRAGVVAVALALMVGPTLGLLFGQEPGFRVMITKKGLDYVSEVCGPILREKLSQLHFSDVHDSTKVKLVGKIEYSLTRVSLQNVDIPNPVLETGQSGLTARISGMSLKMHAKWAYKQKKWPHVKDDGSVDIKAKDISLSQRVSVRDDGSGRLAISSDSCSFSMGKVSVKIHGGASWIYNLFTPFIEKRIKSQLDAQVCKKIIEAINNIGTSITSSLPMNVPLGRDMEVSCALMGDPVFTSSYLATHHNGEFLSPQHPQESPLSPLPLPHPDLTKTTNRMVYVWLTSYPIDTASHVYWQDGHMRHNISHDQVPSFLPRKTSDFKRIIPELYEQFPDQELMYGVKVTVPPSLLLSPGRASWVGDVEASVYVLDMDQAQLAFSMTVSVECDVDVQIQLRPSGLFIMGEVTATNTEINHINSNIGEISSSPFQDLLNVATTFLAVPNINRLLSEGHALPSLKGVSATNTAISVAEGYILVETDLQYSPN